MGGQCGNRGKGRVTALPDFHRGKALLLFLEFLFIILNQVSEIDGKERKHDDAEQGQHKAQNHARGRYGINVAADCGHAHAGPPQGVPEIPDAGIDGVFGNVEDQAGHIDNRQQDQHIGGADRCREVPADVGDNHDQGEEAAQDGDEAEIDEQAARHVEAQKFDDVQVGNGDEEKGKGKDQEARLVPREGEEVKIFDEEDHAGDELIGHVGGIFEKVRALVCVPRDEGDQPEGQQKHDAVQELRHGVAQEGGIRIF